MYIYCITNTLNGLKYVGLTSKTIEERVESAQPAADSAKDMLMAKMQKTGKTLEELEASMPKAEFDKIAEQIAMTDEAYQALMGSVYADGKATDEEVALLAQVRGAAMARQSADVKAAGEAAKMAKENARMTQAMQKVTTSFERMASAMTAAAGRADKVMENGKLGIEAVDNPMAAVQQGQISQSADILSNPEAYSMNEMEGALRQNASMAGPNSEAMVQSAMMPRKLEQSLGTAMQTAKAGGEDDPGTRDAVKKAVLGTVSQAFGGNLPEQMKKNIDDFVTNFKGDIRELDFNDIIKAIPEFANNITASKEVLAAFQAQAASATRAIGMIGDAAQKSAGKGQEIRNRDADTYSTVANSTLAFKRATGEKISYQADAGVRNQARATRLGTSAQVAASPKAMLDRYNQLNKATGTAATAQQQITEANRPALESGDQNQSDGASKAMANAARTTAEFAQATQQARDEIMNLPNDIKENISGIMQELQDVMQERAAKIGAAGGLMEKMLTSTPKDLRKMGNTFNNLNQTLAGKGVSFEQSQSANMAYNQARKQGGSHMQAQRSAQEAYAQESGDTLSMAKELAPLLGAVDPEAQNKMMGSVYESMFAARGQDTSKMMVGDKSMKDYIEMMKAGGKKDPKVQALENALSAQQGALQAANDAAKQLIAQEAEALTTKTHDAVLKAMIAGAEAVRVAVAEGKQIGITPPGEVAKENRENKVKNNKKDIEEAQKTLDSATSTEEEKKKARIVKMEKEQENAVLSGSKSASDVVTRHGGETKEQFEQRKQKLVEKENEIKQEKAAAAQNPQTTAAANQAATTTPQVNNVPPPQASPAPTAATNAQNQAATPTPTAGVVPPQAAPATTPQANNTGAQAAAAPTPPVYGGTQPAPTTSATAAATTNAQTTTAVPTPQVNTSGTPLAPTPQDPGDVIMGKMNEDLRADSLSTEEQSLKELQTNTGEEKYSDSEEDQKVRKEAIQYQKFKVSLLKGKSKEEAGREMFSLGKDDTMTEAQQAMVDSSYKEATNTFADKHQISGPKSDTSNNAVVESVAPQDVVGQMTESQKEDATKKSEALRKSMKDENGQSYGTVNPTTGKMEVTEENHKRREDLHKHERLKQSLLEGKNKEEAMAEEYGHGREYKFMRKEDKKEAEASYTRATESLASDYGIAEVTKPAAKPIPEVSIPLPQNGEETSYNQMAESMGLSAFANQSALPTPAVSAQQEAPLTEEEIGLFNPGYKAPTGTNQQPPQATGAQGAANGQQAATPVPPIATGVPAPVVPQGVYGAGTPLATAVFQDAADAAGTGGHAGFGIAPDPRAGQRVVAQSQQSKANLDAERKAAEQTAKTATEAAMVGAKPVSAAPQQPQKVMSLKELKAQRSEDSKRLALKGAIGDYREQAEADPEGKTLDKTGVMTNKKFLADKEQQLSGMQDKFDEKNPELAAKRKKNSQDSQRRALGESLGGYKKEAEADPEGKTLDKTGAMTNKEFLESKQKQYQTMKEEHKASQSQQTSAPSATGAQSTSTGQQASAPTPQTTPTSGPAPTATPEQQQQGPMSYNEIREQKKKQYDQSRYQKQQQYLGGLSEDARRTEEKKLGSRLLEDPNPTTAPAQNNQLPGTAPASTPSGSSTPQASAPMGAPVAAPRNPQGQASQNQGAGVLSNNGFEAFVSKLDNLLTQLASVNIPTEIKLTSEQLGVNVTLNGGEVMANLPDQLKKDILRQAGEQLANYDQKTTGEGTARSPGVMGGQQV